MILDPFCGCGTAIEAAQRLDREWIGIDITHLAIQVIRDRLASKFPGVQYELLGEPQDVESARVLAETDPYQFQWWAVHRIGAHPIGGTPGRREGRRGPDGGIDGKIKFRVDARTYDIIVSVKGGRSVTPTMVKELHSTVQTERAAIGALVTMQDSTSGMRTAAASAGKWRDPSTGKQYDKIQILTVADIFDGKRVDRPGEDIEQRAPAEGETLVLPGFKLTPPPPRRGRLITVPEKSAEEVTPLRREAPAREAAKVAERRGGSK